MSRWNILMMALGTFSAATAQTTVAPVEIKVFVVDHAQMPEQQLRKALAEATRVLRDAEIEPEWCVDAAARDRCLAAGLKPGRPPITLNLLNEAMAARVPIGVNQFGCTLANIAYIHVPRVQELARNWDFAAPVVLGHIITHELGHVLLGPGIHGDSGLMKAILDKNALVMAHEGRLRFGREEVQRMRERLGR